MVSANAITSEVMTNANLARSDSIIRDISAGERPSNGLELSGPAKTSSSEIAELAGSAPASGYPAFHLKECYPNSKYTAQVRCWLVFAYCLPSSLDLVRAVLPAVLKTLAIPEGDIRLLHLLRVVVDI